MTTKAAVWYRVSTDHQDAANQEKAVAQFNAHHGYTEARRFALADSAWKDGKGGPEYQAALKQLLDEAHRGEFSVLVVWALDRIVRTGAEDTLRLIRKLRECGCVLVSVQESWLNGSSEVQDVLVAFAGWMAEQESKRRSERIRAGLARRKAEGKAIGRQAGALDKSKRRKSGYVKSWEDGGARRAASEAKQANES
jgi:putative DNA-invertase from lambdoid prophage Rac